jgi:transposase
MSVLNDMKVLEVSHRYHLYPSSMKALAFTLFEEGFSTKDVAYLLRRFKKDKSQASFSSTIRRYHKLWKARREEQLEPTH